MFSEISTEYMVPPGNGMLTISFDEYICKFGMLKKTNEEKTKEHNVHAHSHGNVLDHGRGFVLKLYECSSFTMDVCKCL